MGIFGKLFKKENEEDNHRKESWVGHLDIDTSDMFQVFSACYGKMSVI